MSIPWDLGDKFLILPTGVYELDAETGGTMSIPWDDDYFDRPPRCNGCKLAKFKHELGDKFLMLPTGVYELDAKPSKGQGEPSTYGGRPIRFRWWGMSYRHSDECYHWKPPEPKDDDLPF